MFSEITYQDFLLAKDKAAFAVAAVASYQQSSFYRRAIEAQEYFRGRNKAILSRKKYHFAKTGRTQSLSAQITSNFFFRFITQQNQYLLGNGLELSDREHKKKLGFGFDKKLESAGEKALIQGCCYLFWNVTGVELFPADSFLGLLDERTGALMTGIRFWRLREDKPMYLQIYEQDGMTEYLVIDGQKPIQQSDKTPYKLLVRNDGLGKAIRGSGNYDRLPIVPFYANELGESELTDNIKTKIDAYDVILSDFSDNLERANFIYWVINNFGGTGDEVKAMLAEIEELKATYTDGDGATATPHTIDVPFEARRVALDMLKKNMYQDFMALDFDELKGGSLTNVAIRTAVAGLDMKTNRYEWQVFRAIQSLLNLIGLETEDIRFRRQFIANEAETVTMIYQMRQDISHRKALELNPLIAQDEVDGILAEIYGV